MAARAWIGIWLAAVLVAGRGEAGLVLPVHAFDTLTVPTQSAYPLGIVVQPNGDVWFTENSAGKVARYRLAGGFEEFPIQSDFPQPGFMTLGRDGEVWFTETGRGRIANVSSEGTVVEYPLPGEFSTPIDITSTADGTIWFTESPVSRGVEFSLIGRLTPSRVISEFPVDAGVVGITRGPDGAAWFSARGLRGVGPAGLPLPRLGGIGRIDGSGKPTIYPVEGDPLGLTSGADGALWYALSFGDYWIGRLTTDGELSTFAPDLPLPAGVEMQPPQPERITRGPDDNLWFTTYRGSIWRINQAGTMREMLSLSEDEYAEDIAAGPDGRLWFTQPLANQIGRLDALGFAYLNLAQGGPLALARGTDDSVWFVDAVRATIGRIGAAGGLVQYELDEGYAPTAVAVGADGTAWFTDNGRDTIGHITAEGDVVNVTIQPPSNPQDIVLGPDGN
ncbi:MAG: hypothetical protein SF182_10830, partial [Deltaproteobacteria bacterium]|nr:hypothetical protein [Deltaproteobacteria bacterium]